MWVPTKSSYRERTPGIWSMGVKGDFAWKHKTASVYAILSFADNVPLEVLAYGQSGRLDSAYHSFLTDMFEAVHVVERGTCLYACAKVLC